MNFQDGFNLAVSYITELNTLNERYDHDMTPAIQEVIDREWSYFIQELMKIMDKLYLISLTDHCGHYRILFDSLLWDYGIWVGEFWEEESEFREEIIQERLSMSYA
jgi:hypothetical protein|nr:MAG TPA: hypothetical protein [Caudoviricetes sp.]